MSRIQKAIDLKIELRDRQRLVNLSKIKNRSAVVLIKEALTEYLDKEEERAVDDETLLRWREFEEGKIIPNKEIMEWLDSWGREVKENK